MNTVANIRSHLSVANFCSLKVGIALGMAIAIAKGIARAKAPAVGKERERAKGIAADGALA